MRIECAQKAQCLSKPWDILDPDMKTLRTYVDCMEMEDLSMAEQLIREISCRQFLAENLPGHLKFYYTQLLPTH